MYLAGGLRRLRHRRGWAIEEGGLQGASTWARLLLQRVLVGSRPGVEDPPPRPPASIIFSSSTLQPRLSQRQPCICISQPTVPRSTSRVVVVVVVVLSLLRRWFSSANASASVGLVVGLAFGAVSGSVFGHHGSPAQPRLSYRHLWPRSSCSLQLGFAPFGLEATSHCFGSCRVLSYMPVAQGETDTRLDELSH